MHYITYSEYGNITGLYSDDGDYAYPPMGAVAITLADVAQIIGGMGRYKFLNSAIVDNLDYYRQAQISEIEYYYNAALDAPISYMDTVFQAEAESRHMISSVLVALGGSSQPGFGWHDIGNIRVPMTFAQLQGLATTILLRGDPLFQRKQARKASIRAAVSRAEIQAVVW